MCGMDAVYHIYASSIFICVWRKWNYTEEEIVQIRSFHAHSANVESLIISLGISEVNVILSSYATYSIQNWVDDLFSFALRHFLFSQFFQFVLADYVALVIVIVISTT